jgi:hypothetical protein
MAKRMEKPPRRRSRHQTWPLSAVQDCFDIAFSHTERARRFLVARDHQYAQMSLADAAHAHSRARQLLREIRA